MAEFRRRQGTRGQQVAHPAGVHWLASLLLVFAIGDLAPAQPVIRDLRIEMPRAFGYTIGDRIEQRITLGLSDPYRLMREALPEPGRLDHWLALDPVRIEERTDDGGIVYRITLVYRIINLEPGVERLTLPSWRLRFSDDQGRLGTSVPEWSFRVAWLSDPNRPASDVQPDRPPPPMAPPRLELAAAGGGLLLALGLLGYRYGRLPFVSRGPFDRALRELRRLPTPWDATRQRTALRVVHAAFDRAAGGTVLGERLDDLFERQPRLATLREPIADFFERSTALFFRPDRALSPPERMELIRLCRRCRDVLRGVA